jgi:glycogen operon protein
MILCGDEVLQTQRGNNNAYCQDNELSWFDWSLAEKNRDMLRFVTRLIAFRKRHPCLRRRNFLRGTRSEGRGLPDVAWHGVRLNEPLWQDAEARVLVYTLGGIGPEEGDLHVMLNMSDEALDLPLPALTGRLWCRAVDTSRPPPEDIPDAEHQIPMEGKSCPVRARSVVVMESRPALPGETL